LRRAGIREGQRTLIYGASGAVGTSAVQIARHFGAEVTAVCGPANLDLVRSLGVHRGEVVPEDAGGGCPAERPVGSVVIVEVEEAAVGGGALGF
jgi:NADPH:quinone reductase-like Zn-dependent oxidoreductase